jgi:hypothetical protein
MTDYYEQKYLVRMPVHIHKRLSDVAKQERKSMNKIIIDLVRRYVKYYDYEDGYDEYSPPKRRYKPNNTKGDPKQASDNEITELREF